MTWVDNFRLVFDFGSRLAQIHLHRKKFVKGVGKNVRSQSCCNLQSRGTRMLVCSTNDNLTHFGFLIFQIAYHADEVLSISGIDGPVRLIMSL